MIFCFDGKKYYKSCRKIVLRIHTSREGYIEISIGVQYFPHKKARTFEMHSRKNISLIVTLTQILFI